MIEIAILVETGETMLRHRGPAKNSVGPPVKALSRFIEAGLPRFEVLAKRDDERVTWVC